MVRCSSDLFNGSTGILVYLLIIWYCHNIYAGDGTVVRANTGRNFPLNGPSNSARFPVIYTYIYIAVIWTLWLYSCEYDHDMLGFVAV